MLCLGNSVLVSDVPRGTSMKASTAVEITRPDYLIDIDEHDAGI